MEGELVAMETKYMSIALANTILTRYPNPDDIPYWRCCYVQGYVLSGFEKLSAYTGDPGYFDYVRKFVDQHVTEEGDIRDFRGNSMDDMMAGRTIVDVYEKTGEKKYRLAADRIRESSNDYPRNVGSVLWATTIVEKPTQS